MNINFHHLRAFTEVARQGSFTLAAEQLHLTQPAVSKAVGNLEDVLGISLLERTSRQVKLTPAGEALFAHARSIFTLEQAALEDLAARRGLRKGRLTIGASTTIAAYWLAQDLTHFLELYPDLEVRVSSGNTQTMAHQVLEGEVEVALVEGPVADERLDCRLWRNEPLVLVAAAHLAGHGLMVEHCRWILREEGSGTGLVVAGYLARKGLTPAHRVVVESNQAAVQMVVAGAGVAMVPAIMAAPYLSRGELQQLPWTGEELLRPLSKITLRGRPPSPARQAFERLLGENLGLRTQELTARP
ncbi:MAG: LysR family transcriptional regulator [Ferrovum sp.]|nr:LysR family transcriptional regulator [Ferrovum sp.]NDU87140.1 LysR family transcriptional regulator [Ferrovum sp.]